MVKTHHKNFNAAEFQLFFATLTPIPKSYVDFWENSDHVACINYSEKIAAHLPKLNLEQGSNIQRSGKDMTCNFNITLSDFVDIRFTPSANDVGGPHELWLNLMTDELWDDLAQRNPPYNR